jgi:hypothetical protein
MPVTSQPLAMQWPWPRWVLFLAGVEVREPWDLAGLDLDVQSLLELADGLHLPVGSEQSIRGQRHACLLGGSVFGSGR